MLTGVAGLPWMVKPLYGFISDTVPLWGYRRRSYLVVCGLMGEWTFVTPSQVLVTTKALDTPLGSAGCLACFVPGGPASLRPNA